MGERVETEGSFIGSTVAINEEYVFNVLKENAYLPSSMSLREFRHLLRQRSQLEKATSAMNTAEHSQGELKQFKEEDYGLFLSKKTAYKYELNLAKNYHKRYLPPLNPQELQACSVLYSQLQVVKKEDQSKYSKICCMLRYPYQTLYNDFSILNFVSDMNYATFELYFRKVCWLHRKCASARGVCEHVGSFFEANL